MSIRNVCGYEVVSNNCIRKKGNWSRSIDERIKVKKREVGSRSLEGRQLLLIVPRIEDINEKGVVHKWLLQSKKDPWSK